MNPDDAPPASAPQALGALHQLNALLQTALALEPAERQAWLDALPRDADGTVERLRQLLDRAEVETRGFMSGSAAGLLDEADATLALPPDDAPGDHVGPWRLVRELGRGGMATVWLAERDDGPLRRSVALKLPLLAFGETLARRMARERDILASLEHPRIARLYEAGVTPAGRPWLAMERIEGLPIDVYCREKALSVPDRVRLLLQVADALAHAHARLVVHRDLKPSNLLVTAQGEVRLLDFGVAKLLQLDAEPDTDPAADLTRLIGRAVTPDYAAPEQLGGRPVTVAADVYSLGVVAYELLAGRRPYRLDAGRLGQLETALAALHVPPASQVAGVATARALQGDLDTILAKALKRDPAERYRSVEALADDLARHLAGLPVRARPDSLRYRAGKFVRRQHKPLAAAALLLLAVLGGALGTAWQAREAAAERDLARRELQFAQASEAFMRFLLSEGADRPLTTVELLERADALVDRQYTTQPALRTRLQLTVAELLYELKRFAQTGQVLQRALASAQAAGSPALQAQVGCRLAAAQLAQAQADQAQATLDRAIAQLTPAAGADHEAWIDCLRARAFVHRRAGRMDDAVTAARQVLQRIGTPQPGDWPRVLQMTSIVAERHAQQGDLAAAVPLLRDMVARIDALGLARTSAALDLLNNLPVLLWRAGQLTEAATAFERADAHNTSAGRGRAPSLVSNQARLLIDLGRSDEALALLAPALDAADRGSDLQAQAFLRYITATAWCELRDWKGCDEALASVRQRMVAVRPAGHSVFASIDALQARSWLDRGQPERARDGLRAAVAAFAAAKERNSNVVRALGWLALAEAASGQTEEARAHAADAVAQARGFARGFAHSAWLGLALAAQAQVQQHSGQPEAARDLAREAVTQLEATMGAQAPATVAARGLAAR